MWLWGLALVLLALVRSPIHVNMLSGTCPPGTCPVYIYILQLTLIPPLLAWYIQYQHIYSKMYIPPPCARRAHRNPSTYIHPQSVGMIYSIPTLYSKMYIPPPCARRAHRNPPTYIHSPSVSMIYPIPNYIFNWHIFPKLLVAYMQYYYTIVYFKICKLPNPAPEGRTETLQLTFILQVLARYIQYQLIYSTVIYFPKKIAAFIQNIYILSSSSSYQVLFKNITYVGSMGTEAVFVYLCICVFATTYLHFRHPWLSSLRPSVV